MPLAKLRRARGEAGRSELVERHPVMMAPLFPLPKLEAFAGGDCGYGYGYGYGVAGGAGGDWAAGDARKEMERVRGVDYFPRAAQGRR